jgi:hypothetical protein
MSGCASLNRSPGAVAATSTFVAGFDIKIPLVRLMVWIFDGVP